MDVVEKVDRVDAAVSEVDTVDVAISKVDTVDAAISTREIPHVPDVPVEPNPIPVPMSLATKSLDEAPGGLGTDDNEADAPGATITSQGKRILTGSDDSVWTQAHEVDLRVLVKVSLFFRIRFVGNCVAVNRAL
jgi:hypothetical protein